MKYDIEEADFNFTKIVNSIKPHTFKMKEEKEMGITKTHIGFIAEEVEENIPEKVENILVEVDGIKKLSCQNELYFMGRCEGATTKDWAFRGLYVWNDGGDKRVES